MKALEWLRREKDRCPKGHSLDAADPERDGFQDDLHLKSRLCRLCEIAERGAEAYEKERAPGEYQVWAPAEDGWRLDLRSASEQVDDGGEREGAADEHHQRTRPAVWPGPADAEHEHPEHQHQP